MARVAHRDPQRVLPRWLQILTIVVLLLFLLPVVYMVIISLSPDLEAAAGALWPSTFVFSNYLATQSKDFVKQTHRVYHDTAGPSKITVPIIK